ncbi:ABC transporter permease [Paenibacillus daejeonensis]|uniref:ABC transporter permease n=1 Tax=Paenibacillus daejeonensis TaxID=135193 RepID=UPI0003A21A28|nr:ABC transporter permease [Paenibacillus daejeonensis]
MMTLIRMELYKLVAGRWLLVACGGIVAAAVLQAAMHYQWSDRSAWESIVRFPYASGAAYEAILLLFVLPGCFNLERQWGTLTLLLSSRNGRTKVPSAKLWAASLYTTGVVAGCWLLGLTIHLSYGGWEGWDVALQSMPGYADSPWIMPIWQYVLIQIGTNWLGCMTFMLFLLWLSAACRSSLTVFFLGGIVFVLSFLIHNFSVFSLPWALKNLTMMEVLRVENVFNRPRYVLAGPWALHLHPGWFYLYTILLAVVLACSANRRARREEAT